MTAAEWNRLYPAGTTVDAYPLTRDHPPMRTRTRSEAWALGHSAPVVLVENRLGAVALSHIDVVEEIGQ